MNDQTQTAIATVVGLVIANWITVGPIVKHAIKFAWEKSIEWRDLKIEISNFETRISKLEKDVQAAHDKLRKSSTRDVS